MNLLNKDLEPYELRKEQKECNDFIFSNIGSNPTKKFFLLDLPTGVGKSILALSFIQRYLKEVDSKAKFDVLTESKLLQRQYKEDFDSISNLWGRNTYQCTQFSCSCDEGKELQKVSKATKCENCPYEIDRDMFMNGKISLTNFHMFVLMSLNKLLDRRESNVLIVDEAHELESVLSNFISVTLSQKSLSAAGFDDSDKIIKSMKKIVVIDDLVDFMNGELLNLIDGKEKELTNDITSQTKEGVNRDLTLDNILEPTGELDLKTTKKIEALKSLRSKILNFLEEYKADFTNWTLDIEKDEKGKLRYVAQPVWAYPFFDKYIWSKYDKVILMSGTILNEKMFNYLNGIPNPLSLYYRIDSPFKIVNRPIYYIPMGKMTYKTKEQTFEQYLPMLEKLLRKYKNKKGIIHTVTFELQSWLNQKIESDRFLIPSSDQKSKNFALKQHYTSNKPTILVSPSMSTGVNLKDDRARFQIALKVPYPSLASNRNKKRMKDRPDWYAWMTVSKLIQMYGRAVRSEEDSSHFIILDSCFGDVLRYSSHFFPEWVLGAIKQVDV